MKRKLLILTSAAVLSLFASEAKAQAYPYCILGWEERNLYAAPGGQWIGAAPGGSAIQVTGVGPANWLYIQGYWGGGWVAARYIDPGCVPVDCCYAPPPPPPCAVAVRGCAVPYGGPNGEYYHNGNGHHNGGNGYHNSNGYHDKGQYQEPAPAPETLPEAPMPQATPAPETNCYTTNEGCGHK